MVFSVGLLLVLRSLHGIGFSATTNAPGTIVSDIVPKSRLAEGVGYYVLSNTLATAVGPALTLFIIQYFSYNVLFLVSSLFTAKDIGGGFGAVIWGFISLNAGFRPVYLYCVISIILAIIAYQLILRKQINSNKKIDGALKHSA